MGEVSSKRKENYVKFNFVLVITSLTVTKSLVDDKKKQQENCSRKQSEERNMKMYFMFQLFINMIKSS